MGYGCSSFKYSKGVNTLQGEEQFNPKDNVSRETNGYRLSLNYLDEKFNEVSNHPSKEVQNSFPQKYWEAEK